MAVLGYWILDFPFWIALVISLLALLVNGVVATVEDDLPGGFNNPDGTATPRYIRKLGFTVRLVSLGLVLVCAVMLILWKFG